MFRSLLVAASLFLATTASANTNLFNAVQTHTQQIIQDVVTQGLEFKKGDQAAYKLNMAGFINGTMTMLVEDVLTEGVWIAQDMDLGFMGKQNIRQLIDPNTGEIKRLIVNGKEEAIPAQGDVEVIDSKEASVTVPAGTFVCFYIKAKITQDGKVTNAEQWLNLKDVPVMGMVKSIMDSQFGPVTIELTSFRRM